jgi:hypothetical protein
VQCRVFVFKCTPLASELKLVRPLNVVELALKTLSSFMLAFDFGYEVFDVPR